MKKTNKKDFPTKDDYNYCRDIHCPLNLDCKRYATFETQATLLYQPSDENTCELYIETE